jgi:hypothetical protein
MPTGGSGNLGWLSAIWKLISDRIPALSNGKIPVEVGSLNVSVSNASLEIANDVGNPVPISDAGGSITVDGTFWQATQPVSAASLPLPSGAATAANQSTGNTSLASIDTKTPALGQALASGSTPVVLPSAMVTDLKSVSITGTLPAFAVTPTVNIDTAPNLTFTNTSFTANAGTNLNTSALALESGGNLAGINTKLPSGLTVTSTRLLVDGSGVTQPVSITTLPALGTGTNNIGSITDITGTVSLPTGAATSVNQTTANTSLSSIDGKIPALVNGRLPVDTTSAQGQAWESEATITRAANTTGYIANDVYGTVFQLTNIGSSGGFIFLNSLDIVFNLTALPSGMGSFIVYLYSSSPPSAITDNNPFSVASGDRASILTLNGFSLTASLARGGGSVVAESLNINQLFKLATGSTSLWGYLVTTGAFNPAANSETAIITARSFAP